MAGALVSTGRARGADGGREAPIEHAANSSEGPADQSVQQRDEAMAVAATVVAAFAVVVVRSGIR